LLASGLWVAQEEKKEKMPGFEEDKEDKRGSWDPKYKDPVIWKFNPWEPPQWEENGAVEIAQPDGIWKIPSVYGNRKVLRFPLRPQIGPCVRWGVFVRAMYREKWIINTLDDVVPAVDPLAFQVRPPQTTQISQPKGPPFHYRLRKAVASGDAKMKISIVAESWTRKVWSGGPRAEDGCAANGWSDPSLEISSTTRQKNGRDCWS